MSPGLIWSSRILRSLRDARGIRSLLPASHGHADIVNDVDRLFRYFGFRPYAEGNGADDREYIIGPIQLVARD
jgi:hypothetical protein